MKLTKGNVYVNLQGKTKEELTYLYEFLTSNGEKVWRDLDYFLTYEDEFLVFNKDWYGSYGTESKNEITIPQLKQILQPMDLTIEQRLEKAEAEVKRLKESIEDSKIKVGDWVVINETKAIFKVKDNDLIWCIKYSKKIQDKELIKLLEQEIK